MTAKKRTPSSEPAVRAELDAYLLANLKAGSVVVASPEAVADLQYFSDKAAKGSAIKIDALSAWMNEKHGLPLLGQTALYGLCTRNGIKPWFGK